MKKKIFNILKILLPVLIGFYICWYFWNSFDEKAKVSFFDVFKEANYFILFVSLLIGLISHLSRAYRWKYMLRPLGFEPSLKNSYNAIMIGYIANMVVPRMGEASRAAVLKGTDGVPFDKGFGTIVAERVIDVLCLGIVAGIAILINFDNMEDLLLLAERTNEANVSAEPNTPWLKYTVFGLMGLGAIGFSFLFFTKPKFKEKFLGFVKGFTDGIKTIYTMRDRWGYLLHTVIIWVCYVTMFWVTFYAWEGTENMPVDGILSAFIAGTIGFIIVQGGIGTYPLMVGVVLTFFLAPEWLIDDPTTLELNDGKTMPAHIGFGALVWATQTLLIVFLGLLSLGMVQVNKKRLN